MAAPENNQQAKNWLVKSSTKVSGPYTREEVIAMLARRQITIIDEVRQPEGRWNYIRENRHFKEIVKNLRYEQDHSREDTMTSTATIGTATMTKTDNGQGILDEFTPTPLTPPTTPPKKQSSSLIKDVTPTSEDAAKMAKTTAATKSFGNMQDQRVQNKIQKQNFVLRSILMTIVAGALVFASLTYFKKEKKTDLSYDQLLSSALRYKEMGLYDKALDNYKKASTIREPDLESQFQMVFLLINEDRQSLNGRRIIERALLKEGRTHNEIMEGQLGMALSYMMEGDLRQAEDYLQKTLSYDANNESAKVNLAVILLKKGNYAQALKSFESLSKQDSPSYPLVLLCKSMALIELSKAQLDKEHLQNALNEITAYISKSHFLHKELALLLIYMNQLLQNSSGELDAISTFMDEPQNLSRLYAKDLTVDWRNAEWDYLERYCSDLYNSGKGPASMKAVRAICLIESNRDMEAAKFIDESLAQGPKQLTSLQAQAEYLWKLGRLSEASFLFQGNEFKQTRLALYIQGENCLKTKDYNCAQGAYKTLAERDFGDVLAHYGLAQVALASNDKVRAQSEIKAGFEAETNFAPLIELRDKMESP